MLSIAVRSTAPVSETQRRYNTQFEKKLFNISTFSYLDDALMLSWNRCLPKLFFVKKPKPPQIRLSQQVSEFATKLFVLSLVSSVTSSFSFLKEDFVAWIVSHGRFFLLCSTILGMYVSIMLKKGACHCESEALTSSLISDSQLVWLMRYLALQKSALA